MHDGEIRDQYHALAYLLPTKFQVPTEFDSWKDTYEGLEFVEERRKPFLLLGSNLDIKLVRPAT
jgi:hypothetical protein